MQIVQVTQVSDALVPAFERLIPQLSSSSSPTTRAELEEIVSVPGSTLLIAQDPSQGAKIVGTLTLILFHIPTGLRAWIEDVVVDAAYRRRGVGTALTRAALERAQAADARTVDLTSRPSREAAHRLYGQVGCVQREMNVYRCTFDS